MALVALYKRRVSRWHIKNRGKDPQFSSIKQTFSDAKNDVISD